MSAIQHEIGECFGTFNDALQHAVIALGGYKKVGPAFKTEMPIEQAAQWLRDCLAPGRREKLSPDQVLLLVRMARQAGIHAPMDYMASTTGYKATPVDADAQKRQLQETIAAGMESLTRQMARLEALNSSAAR